MAASNTRKRKMPTAITAVNLQKRIPLKPQVILKAAKTILRHEGIKRAELSIVFVTDARIKSLNKKYLNQNNPTDVLAFNFLRHSDPAAVKRGKNLKVRRSFASLRMTEVHAPQISGEIIISVDTAVKHAQIYHTTPHREILLYVVHGILHLLDYDDHRDADIRKMRRKEQILMNVISK